MAPLRDLAKGESSGVAAGVRVRAEAATLVSPALRACINSVIASVMKPTKMAKTTSPLKSMTA